MLQISTTRKYIQITANPNVAVAFGNLQIEGVAKSKGHPSEDQNIGFIKAFQKKYPQVYEMYKEELDDPGNNWKLIEIIPTRIAVYHGRPDVHLDVMHTRNKKAYKFDSSDMDSTYE